MRAVLLSILLLVAFSSYCQQGKPGYWMHRSRILFEEEKYKEAEQYADSALMKTPPSEFDSLIQIHLWLYDIHLASKNYELALSDYKSVVILHDSVNAKRSRAVEDSLGVRLNRATEMYRLDSIANVAKVQALEIRNSDDVRNLMIISGSIVLLSAILIFFFYRKKIDTEKSLAQLNDELLGLNGFKQKLYAVLSYELKNSLNSFENLTQSLDKELASASDSERQEFFENLHAASAELKDSIVNVGHWVAYQADAKPLRQDLFDCKRLAEKVLEKYRWRINARRLRSDIFIPEGQLVFADQETIEIVLDNLLTNAIQFTRAGSITLFSGRKDGLVTLGVKDTGGGIAKDDLDKLFSLQEDFHSIGRSSQKGAGVGLVLCKQLVEKNGGRIYAESTLGEGSTFYFTLPEKRD